MRRSAALLLSLLAAASCRDGSAGPRNWPDTWLYPYDAVPVVAPRGMVVTTDRYASEVGVEVLRSGGNAVDAAVAVALALAVVNPEAGNLGGGGFMVVHMADGTAATLDFREKAPAAATPDMFLDSLGNVTEKSLVGHLAAGVPGTVRGLWDAHARFGTRPWEELVQPAVGLARGFAVTERFTLSLGGGVVEELSRFPASAAVFLPGGRPPSVGDTLRQPDLAATLTRIGQAGADGFYLGETADLIVREMERGGGLITHEDLRAYTAAWREPVRFEYRGHTVLSMPPSSSGGVTLAESAGILETFQLGELEWHDGEHVHLLAEAWRRAFADRNHYLADPDFVPTPRELLASPAYAAWRAADISPERATPSLQVRPGLEAYSPGAWPPASAPSPRVEGGNTTHFSVVDSLGNAVSLTTTINSWYGSKVVVEGAGFLLNNEMDDFSAKPGEPNQFGLVQGEANAIEPGKRMLSAMTPVIVLDPQGRLFMVAGSPGGPTIITTVFQVLSNVVDHGMNLAQAVLAPRVHHQHLPDRIEYEEGGLPEEVVEELRELGHAVREERDTSGDVQAILVAPDGTLHGQSDPRLGGVAVGY